MDDISATTLSQTQTANHPQLSTGRNPSAAQIGVCVHEILRKIFEAQITARVEGVIPLKEITQKVLASYPALTPEDFARVIELCQNAIDMGWLRTSAQQAGQKVVFDIALPTGQHIKGEIDRLDVAVKRDGKTYADVIEIKTGTIKQDAEEGWQAKIYNIGARATIPNLTTAVTISIWDLNNKQILRSVKTAKDAIEDLTEAIKLARQLPAPPKKTEVLPPLLPDDNITIPSYKASQSTPVKATTPISIPEPPKAESVEERMMRIAKMMEDEQRNASRDRDLEQDTGGQSKNRQHDITSQHVKPPRKDCDNPNRTKDKRPADRDPDVDKDPDLKAD